MRALLAISILALAACSVTAPTSRATDEITHGTLDPGDAGVVALVRGAGYLCSGTLIAPRVVLTAAHCLLPEPPDAIVVGSDPDAGERIAVIDRRAAPTFDRATGADDIAVLLLADPAPAAPWPLAPDLESARGATLRLVGFGQADPAAPAPWRKREGAAPIDRLDARTFTFHGGATGAQTCVGDSGGPAFVTIDGVEYLAGVTSRGDPACADFAIDTRVDVHLEALIMPYLRDTAIQDGAVGARCFDDASCVSGACVADGSDRFCSVHCATARDCPDDLACIAGACRPSEPAPGAEGAACARDGDCGGGTGLCARTELDDAAVCRIECSPLDAPACGEGATCQHVEGGRAAFACLPDAAGCAVGAQRSGWMMLVVVALVLGATGRTRRGLRALAHRVRGLWRPRPDTGSRRRRIVIALLFASHAGLTLWGAHRNSVTVDEAAHLASGVYHWHTGNFALYRVNPPFVRMLATLPVIAAGAEVPARDPLDVPSFRPETGYAMELAHVNRDRYQDLVWLARLAGIAWSLLGAWIVLRWASELFGPRAGLLALALWCLEPNIVAHAQLLTPDMPATVSGLLATFVFWRYLRAPSWRLAGLAGLLLGIAQLTKLTLLVLYPLWLALWLIHHAGALRGAWRRGLVHAAAACAISVLVLNAGYGFSGTGTRLGSVMFVSESFTGRHRSDVDRAAAPHLVSLGNRFTGTALAGVPLPLPVDYVRGADLQRRDFEKRMRSYLRGTWRVGGWHGYYLYGLAIKLPLGLLGLLAWAIGRSLRRDRVAWRDKVAVILPPLAILGFVSSQVGFTHHVRYVLPALPFLIILASRIAERTLPTLRAATAAVLVAWFALSALRYQPHTLSYFNELVGGPTRGAEHLVDSNIDWGQDLLGLRRWLDDHPQSSPLQLAYFGSIDPAVAGIAYTLPPAGVDELQPGTYAISVNFVHGLRFRAFDGAGRIRVVEPDDFRAFRDLEPDARIGYSILIFELTPAKLARLRSAATDNHPPH